MGATLLIKVGLTPALIAAASLAGRRWGPGISGWLVGFPFTSAPVALILTIEHGDSFAAAAAAAILMGALSQAGFCLAYTALAARAPWPACLAAGTAAFAVLTLLLRPVSLPLPVVAVVVVAGLGLALYLLPRGAAPPAAAPRAAWDLPLRMAVATAFVVVVTALAPLIGARLSGLITPFPLYAAILAVFAHGAQGPAAGAGVLRGLTLGLFGFSAFFFTLALLLVPAGPAVAFAAAAAAVVAVQALTLRAVGPRGSG